GSSSIRTAPSRVDGGRTRRAQSISRLNPATDIPSRHISDSSGTCRTRQPSSPRLGTWNSRGPSPSSPNPRRQRARRSSCSLASAAATAGPSSPSSSSSVCAATGVSLRVLHPRRLAREADVVGQPLQHDLVLADLQQAEAAFDPEDHALRRVAQAAVEQLLLLRDLRVRQHLRRVVTAYHHALDVLDLAQVGHRLPPARKSPSRRRPP